MIVEGGNSDFSFLGCKMCRIRLIRKYVFNKYKYIYFFYKNLRFVRVGIFVYIIFCFNFGVYKFRIELEFNEYLLIEFNNGIRLYFIYIFKMKLCCF